MPTIKQLSRIQSEDNGLNRLQDQLASALNPILREVKGDLSGPLEAPTVGGLQGRQVAPKAPSTGDTLIFDGSQWMPGVPAPLPIGTLRFETSAIQNLTASTTQQLTPTTTLHRFVCAAGNVSLSGVPTILWSGVVTGQVVILENVGAAGTGHLTLNRGTTQKLSLSAANSRIDEGGTMLLVWDGANWIEVTHTQATST